MKYLLFVITTVLMTFINFESSAQTSSNSLGNSSALLVHDSIGVFENIKEEKKNEFSNTYDEGTNDPISVGMTLEYWGTQEVYRKTTSVNGLHVVLIYIPKKD